MVTPEVGPPTENRDRIPLLRPLRESLQREVDRAKDEPGYAMVLGVLALDLVIGGVVGVVIYQRDPEALINCIQGLGVVYLGIRGLTFYAPKAIGFVHARFSRTDGS